MKQMNVRTWTVLLAMTMALTAAMVGAGSAGAQEIDDGGFRLPPLTATVEGECDHKPSPVPEPCKHPKPTTPVAPTPEPTTGPTVEPTPEPTPQPTTEPAVEPTPEPTPQPTTEPAVEPTVLPIQPTPTSTETPVVAAPESGAGPIGGQPDELARTGPSLSVGLIVIGLTATGAGMMVLATRRRFDPR